LEVADQEPLMKQNGLAVYRQASHQVKHGLTLIYEEIRSQGDNTILMSQLREEAREESLSGRTQKATISDQETLKTAGHISTTCAADISTTDENLFS
jgi:hypothetical protein